METHNLEVLLDDNLARALSIVSESYEISISEKEVDFLLKRYKRDIKSMMVALHSLDDLSASQKRKITVPLIKEFLDS
jgi:DnaA family protein